MRSSPTYCILRNSTFWFNFRLPGHRSPLRFSLRTKERRIAHTLAHHISFRLHRQLQQGGQILNESKQALTQLAKQWASEWFEELRQHDLEQGQLSYAQAEQHEEIYGEWLADERERYALNDFSKVSETARSLLDEPVDPNGLTLKQLCQEVSRQTINVYSHLFDKFSKGEPLPDTLHPEASAPDQPEIPAVQHKVSEVYAEFAAEKIKSGEWSRQRTENENALAIRMFIELVGDLNMSSIDKACGRSFKEKLLRYPSQREKLAHLKDLPIDDILNGQQEYEAISVRTASNRFVKVAAFLNWAANNGYIEANPLSGMGIKVKKNKKDTRKPFATNDLKSIFRSPVFTEGKRKHDYYYWLPLIALYTGARIEEICQLNLCDIKEVNGVLCFNITDEGEGQQLKNESSRRMVPVHHKLIELGLLRYAEQRRAQGATMLLPQLEKISERYSHNPSKWFGRFKKTLGITDSAKTFHSFRHSAIDHLRATHAPDYAIKEIVGHTDESATHAIYGSRDVTPLKPVIDMIDWSEAVEQVQPFC